jgi:hypothetical protein
MNEHDDDIARLFARDAPPQQSDEQSDDFAASVKQAIKRERMRAKLLASTGVAVFVVLLALAAYLGPFGSLNPVQVAPIQILQQYLMTFTGALACAACALGLTAWLRLGDA